MPICSNVNPLYALHGDEWNAYKHIICAWIMYSVSDILYIPRSMLNAHAFTLVTLTIYLCVKSFKWPTH